MPRLVYPKRRSERRKSRRMIGSNLHLMRSNLPSGLGHSLADSAFTQEVLFQSSDLPIEKIGRLPNDADSNIRDNICGAGFEEFAKCFEGGVALTGKSANIFRFARIFIP